MDTRPEAAVGTPPPREPPALPRERILWVPLGCYVAVTVVAPLLNGAGSEPAFVEHAAWILGACALLLGGWALGCRLAEGGARRFRRPGRPR